MGACQPQTSNYSCSLKTPLTTNPHITRFPLEGYILDVLWGQRIQVVSTSEFHEYWCNDVDFIFLSPWLVEGPQKSQTLTASKPRYEDFGPKIKFLIKKRYLGVLTF